MLLATVVSKRLSLLTSVVPKWLRLQLLLLVATLAVLLATSYRPAHSSLLLQLDWNRVLGGNWTLLARNLLRLRLVLVRWELLDDWVLVDPGLRFHTTGTGIRV
jgi:hypothetical protein